MELARVGAFRIDSGNSGHCYTKILRVIRSDKAVVSMMAGTITMVLVISAVLPSLAKEDSHGVWDL